jgi:multicomponent Na+:H+ antiporter subunit E
VNYFIWNIVLALTWAGVNGDFTINTVAVGFLLGYLVLLISERIPAHPKYFKRVRLVILFSLFYLRELIVANVRVAYSVIVPRNLLKPGVIAVPLDAKSDSEITLLSVLVTLTPGTLSIDVSADRRFLYVHTLFIDDLEEARRSIKTGIERRLLEVMR